MRKNLKCLAKVAVGIALLTSPFPVYASDAGHSSLINCNSKAGTYVFHHAATGGGGGENITIIDGNIYTENNPFNFDTSVIQYGDKFKFINAPAWFTINNNAPATNYYSAIAQNFILEAINVPTNPTETNPLKLYYKEYYYSKSTYYDTYINIYIGVNETRATLTQQSAFSTEKNYSIYGEWWFYKLPKTYFNPTDQNGLTRKGYVDSLPTTYAGYDATKTQVLKNINGVLTWQDE